MKTTFYGLTRFSSAVTTQEQGTQLVRARNLPAVLAFEFYPTLVLGASCIQNETSEPLWKSQNLFEDQGFEIAESSRGVSRLHSPGQLVIYPVVPIGHLRITQEEFVEVLQEATINWLQKFRIEAQAVSGSAVMTSRGKIAMITSSEHAGVTQDGISLNVSNDLGLFEMLQSSSSQKETYDSLSEHGAILELGEVFELWLQYFTERLLNKIPMNAT